MRVTQGAWSRRAHAAAEQNNFPRLGDCWRQDGFDRVQTPLHRQGKRRPRRLRAEYTATQAVIGRSTTERVCTLVRVGNSFHALPEICASRSAASTRGAGPLSTLPPIYSFQRPEPFQHAEIGAAILP
jgi:hypothetical protein